MKRIGFLVALGLAAAVALGSQPAELQVRLYWLQSPAMLRIVGESGASRIRFCSPCGDAEPIPALEIRASRGRVEVPAQGWSGDSIELTGLYRLEPQGHPALKLSYPLRINAAEGRLQLTIRIPLEEYVAGVLAGESSSFASMESLKAMAVTARTFAVRFRGRHPLRQLCRQINPERKESDITHPIADAPTNSQGASQLASAECRRPLRSGLETRRRLVYKRKVEIGNPA